MTLYHFCSQIDLGGIILIMAGFAMLLLPLSVAAETPSSLEDTLVQGIGTGAIETVIIIAAQVAVPYAEMAQITSTEHLLLQSLRPITCNCGETVSEAIANGCRYDSLAAAWLSPACRNDELIGHFEHAGPNPDGSWLYYADKNKTQVLSLEEVSMLPETGGHFFTTHQWHLVHCAYYWKKMFLAIEKGTIIEHRYNNLAHLEHCEMMFLKRDPLDAIVTEVGVSLHSDVIVIAQKHDHGNKARLV
ncbi:uncharacterized protein BDW43DRAFT_306889 [Aspergillus alliaceus]|uniref:uncharacterized protein n=1 Tax=Petromyces alliaceus TaxID=209559 RepID=UPI0012A7658F|nr:uncharacterized protein BDW43DRAFT_306889 [Aspergillus alliaceus]KAB8238203.1 hypothetical protein BDW43DRAFT_306889 [Aspergillus alliaceus]